MIHVFDVFLAPFGAKIKMQSSDTLFLASPFMVFFLRFGHLEEMFNVSKICEVPRASKVATYFQANPGPLVSLAV